MRLRAFSEDYRFVCTCSKWIKSPSTASVGKLFQLQGVRQTKQRTSFLPYNHRNQAGPVSQRLLLGRSKKTKDFDMNTRTQARSPTLSRASTAVGTGGRLRYIFRCIPARIAVAIVSPILFLTSLVMLILGIMVARVLGTR